MAMVSLLETDKLSLKKKNAQLGGLNTPKVSLQFGI